MKSDDDKVSQFRSFADEPKNILKCLAPELVPASIVSTVAGTRLGGGIISPDISGLSGKTC